MTNESGRFCENKNKEWVVPKILIVGGGYAGFYTAWKLEKWLKKDEAKVTLVDPLPYMTYQPFLPEVVAGSVEPRHAIVDTRQHLKRTRIIAGKVTGIEHAKKTAAVQTEVGEKLDLDYDIVVFTAGAVSRTFPIPGVAEEAIGLKAIEEAMAIHDRILTNFDKAAVLPDGPEKKKLLSFVVVGGGFAGIEVFGEMRSLATARLQMYPSIKWDDVRFDLIEAMGRIMPEVSHETSLEVIKNLEDRGAKVHLDTQLKSAENKHIVTSTGEEWDADLIVWTAGVMANPMLRNTDFPLDERGRLRVRADLRVEGDDGIVEGAWGAGDATAVPDLTGGGVGGFCVPNAQHAVRQAKRLAANIVAVLRGQQPTDYKHENLGAVASTGLYEGAFQSGKLALTGFPAWLAHRGYHGLAVPTFERKSRVFTGWINNFVWGRDFASTERRAEPRAIFEEFASKPKAK